MSEAAQVVLVLHPGGTSWQIQEAEKITFNDKDKMRAGSSKNLELRGDDYKKLPAQPILRASLIRRHAGGYLVVKNGANWDPVAPDGVNVKAPVTYAALWTSVKISIQKDRNSKTAAPINAADLFAVLSGGDRNEAIANLLTDQANFRGVGEKDAAAALDEWRSLLVAMAPSLTGAPGAKIQQMLASRMESADGKLSTGLAHNSDLEDGLWYVQVSRDAYPKDQGQEKARLALLQKKAWLDQRTAILRAFSAGGLWDAFLDKYGDLERWDNSFEDVRKLRERAFSASTSQHLAEGKRLNEGKQYPLALKELTMAQTRSPGNKEIKGLIETVSLEEHRGHATLVKTTQEDRNSARQTQMRGHLQTAENYVRDKQWDDAENEIAQAEALDKDSPSILLTRARLLNARGQPLKATEMLDRYDRVVTTSEDIDLGHVLQININYELKKKKQALKGEIPKAETDGDYVQASARAEEGLALDGNDLDFLLHSGLTRAMLRKNAEAEHLLNNYLRLSQAPGSDTKQRQEVYNLLPKVKEIIPEPEGSPNWFSGYKSPAGIFYCPISLMPNARVAEVHASRKQTTSFQWTNDVLNMVRVTAQQPGEQGFTAYFDYFPDRKAVRRVSTEALADAKEALATPRFTPNGPMGAGKGVYVALLNHPAIDPVMVEKLTGKRVATIVAGNPYFNPFVWNGVYLFLAEYDNQGRIHSARQIPAGDHKDPHEFEFQWDGLRLIEIAERGTGDYRRTMTYTGGKLVRETISFHGKSSKIEYTYKGDRLVEASSGDDPSIDGRSRHVSFR